LKIESEKLILLHPGKTGGTSLEHTFKKKYLNHEKLNARLENINIMFGFSKTYKFFLQHADLNFYKKILDINLKDYKTIATVRNPYDRLVSCYHYNGKSKNFSFEDFVVNHLESHILSNNKKSYSINHFAPQITFCKLDDYCVDHIIKLESFSDDLNKIGIDVQFHFSKTRSRKKNYTDYYNQKTKDLVYELYKEDFEYLNYQKLQ
jgi:hypothetical protein